MESAVPETPPTTILLMDGMGCHAQATPAFSACHLALVPPLLPCLAATHPDAFVLPTAFFPPLISHVQVRKGTGTRVARGHHQVTHVVVAHASALKSG